MPAMILSIPPLVVSILSVLAYHATQSHTNGQRGSLSAILVTSTAILLSTFILFRIGKSTIERHAPNEIAKKKALAQSTYALPFWSLVISICVVRALHYCLGDILPLFSNGSDVEEVSRGWMNWGLGIVTTTLFWAIKVAGACVGPALGWTVMSVLVLCRYTGPFCPIVRCSSTPLRTNPFDATLQRLGRNFTSKNRFLDMIADGLDKLSAPSKPPPANMKQSTNQTKSTSFMAAMPTTKANTNAMNQRALQQPNNNTDGVGRLLNFLVSSSNARYSRPGLLSILVQVLVNAIGGHVFARAFVLPHLGMENMEDTVVVIVMLSCLLVPVFELFSSINEAELHYSYYSSFGSLAVVGNRFHLQPVLVALVKDVMLRVKRSILGVTLLAPVIATGTILLWSHLGPLVLSDGSFTLSSPSYRTIMESLFISYLTMALLVSIMAIQDVLTRWAVCAPGMDADVLMFQTPTTTSKSNDASSTSKFLAEDLFIQSILMGDGATVDKVITPPGAKPSQASMVPSKNHQEDEISRNEIAAASFSEWIQQSSATSSGKVSDDILRMSLLESLGGGGSANPTPPRQSHPFHFGHARHSAAVRKRLDLSAATASPGRQPIAVPIVRALCAFSGGVGDAMSQFYRQLDKDGKPLRKNNSAELWKLPPGSLNAVEFAIIAAARLVVMNSVMTDKHGRVVVNASKRHERLSLLLPCILQSAYKVRCGLHEYARATANMYEVNLSTYDKSGKGDGLGCFIATKCPDLCPVISACNDSAKMAMKTLVESGDRSIEDVLLRRKWKGDMQQWLVGLNCEEAPVARTGSNHKLMFAI